MSRHVIHFKMRVTRQAPWEIICSTPYAFRTTSEYDEVTCKVCRRTVEREAAKVRAIFERARATVEARKAGAR